MKNLKILFFLLFSWFGYEVAFGMDSLSLLLPIPEDGWIRSEAMEIYNRQNLFDYIDGGAELFLAYDFQKLSVQRFIPATGDSIEEKTITVEIWQMNSSADAFGVFSLDQDGEKVTIGQSGVYNDGYLRFWKGVFFVKILQMLGSSKEAIIQLGSKIDQKIQLEGKLPPLVLKTPSDSLVPNSVCFFHQQIILNYLYFFSDQNRLDLNKETDCVLAEFRVCEDRLKLLLIQYPDTTKAKTIETSLKESHVTKGVIAPDKMPASKERELSGMELSRNYLILVFEGKDKQNIKWLLASAKSSLEGGEKLMKPRCFRFR